MTSKVPAQCLACARLDRSRTGRNGDMPGPPEVIVERCEAFPDGIPVSIALGADHRQAVEGDHGLRFLQQPTEEAHEAFADWTETFG